MNARNDTSGFIVPARTSALSHAAHITKVHIAVVPSRFATKQPDAGFAAVAQESTTRGRQTMLFRQTQTVCSLPLIGHAIAVAVPR